MDLTVEQAVRDFIIKFNANVLPEQPVLADASVTSKWLELIREEAEELHYACASGNLVAILDGVADLIYVACGLGVSHGLPIDKGFAEVHRSNMTKLGADGKPIYREDGKVLKGPNYDPPHLKEIIFAAD